MIDPGIDQPWSRPARGDVLRDRAQDLVADSSGQDGLAEPAAKVRAEVQCCEDGPAAVADDVLGGEGLAAVEGGLHHREEAREIAEDNVALLEDIQGAFETAADYDELHNMLALQADCAEVWQYVEDAEYRYLANKLGLTGVEANIEFDADRLTELADAMEATWGAGVSPGNPARIRNFVADFRDGFAEQPDAESYAQMRIFDVASEDIGGGRMRITWKTDAPSTTQVDWALALPIYDHTTGEMETATTDHSVEIDIIEEGRPHVFRVGSRGADGLFIRTGDFWFGMDP